LQWRPSHLAAELVKSFGPFRGERLLNLFAHHVKDLLEVLPGGAHLAPGLVYQDDAVRVELLYTKLFILRKLVLQNIILQTQNTSESKIIIPALK